MKIITANTLNDGRVVYLTADDSWTTELPLALKIDDAQIDAVLEKAKARVREVADIYAVSVDENGALNGRDALREQIRQKGPTNRTDLGYQAEA